MEIYLDLSKSLVPKKVLVRGEHGKTFYATRYVNPDAEQGEMNFSHIDPNRSHKDVIKDVADHVRKHWSNIHHSINNHMSEVDDDHVYKTKLHALEGIGKSGSDFSVIGSHPKVLNSALRHIMGDERYEKAKEKLAHANLTINADEGAIDHILQDGYYSGSLYDNLSEQGKKKYDSIVNSDSSPEDKMKQLQEWGSDFDQDDAFTVSDMVSRLKAHLKAYGHGPGTKQPLYAAFNPDGHPDGGAPHFGEGVVQVHPSMLKYSTGSSNDTLVHHDPISHIYSGNHLKDLYMLKTLQSGGNKKFDTKEEDLESWQSPWYSSKDHEEDIPFELQYHKDHLDPRLLRRG